MRTVHTLALVPGLVLGISTVGGLAHAADPNDGDVSNPYTTSKVPAITHAFEIGLGGGYTQGWGDVGNGMSSLDDLSKAGGTVELRLGYRATPHLTFGAYGSYAQFAEGDRLSNTDVRSSTAGAFADWHFLPAGEIDPWVSLASGWRGEWLDGMDGVTSMNGWDIARLQVGVDFRMTPEVAIGPFIGAGVTTFFTKEDAGETSFSNIQDPKANAFVFAGLEARFDVLGRHVK